ncbi:MAG: aldo/keto reductase, partial [Polyangiaceae bacterium]
MGKWAAHPGLALANIRRSIEDSLRRLRTDYVDLYYAHEDDSNVPQEEYVRAFDALVREGKVRVLGASNFTPERLTSALAIARKNGFHPFRISQDHYNLVERGFETSLRPTIEREKLVELPYGSLAAGFLTGKYRLGKRAESARAGGAAKYLEDPKNVALLGVLDEVAAAHGVSVAAIALAWLHAQPTVGAPIASARTIEQLAPLFEGARTKLSSDELAKLSAATG